MKRASQRGLSLIFALLALVALTLGAVALVRSVDVGVLTLANLGEKQTSLAAASEGAERALNWLAPNVNVPGFLDSDRPESGYYSSARDNLDPTGISLGHGVLNLPFVDWDSNGCKIDGIQHGGACLQASEPVTVGSETVRFVILRQCHFADRTMQPEDNSCARPPFNPATTGANKGNPDLQAEVPATTPASAYFRIIVRAANSRGTVAFSETLAHY